MPNVFIESINEFCDRHGGVGLPYSPNGDILFPDGARIAADGRSRHEPPDDERDRLQWQVTFLELKLKRANENYRRTQSYIEAQARFHALNAGPLPHPQAFEDLKRLQKTYCKIEADLNAKREELSALGPSPMEQYQHRRNQQKLAAQQAVERMRAITGDTAEAATERDHKAMENRIKHAQQAESTMLESAFLQTAGIKMKGK